MKVRLILFLFVLSAGLSLYWPVRDVVWLTILALQAGWYVADMLSRLVHMFMDYHPYPKDKDLDRPILRRLLRGWSMTSKTTIRGRRRTSCIRTRFGAISARVAVGLTG